MRSATFILAIMAFASPALAQEDRFAPDNPWFRDFEATCRDGQSGMDEACQAGVLGAYADFAGSFDVTCDFAAFWRARDEDMAFDAFAVLPWQSGVEAIVQADGVCEAK